MQSDQVPFIVSRGNQSALGSVTTSGELIDMLSEVLDDEQQIELAVGNLVEFQVSVGGVGWHLVTEPGVDGMSLRGRVSGGMPAGSAPGRSVQIPAVDSDFTARAAADDLPPAVDDELDISLEDAPPPPADPFADDPFAASPDPEPPAEAAAGPGDDADFGLGGEVGFASPQAPTATSTPSTSDPGGYDPFATPTVGEDPFGGLDAPYAGTRQDVPAVDLDAGEQTLPDDDDLPPLTDDDDAFAADFAFVDGAGAASEGTAASSPSGAKGDNDVIRRMPATRETEKVDDDDAAAQAPPPLRMQTPDPDAPDRRRRPSSGATVQISAAEAANEMARQLARQTGTQEMNRRSGTGTTFRAITPDRATWEVVSGADELEKLTRFIGEGSLVHVLGSGAMDIVGSEDSICFLDGDEPKQNLDATEGHAPGTWIVLSLDDPSAWLGWVMRRLEEGHRVLVESRARTAEGAWRTLVGLDGGRRAEHWISHHAHLGIIAEDARWRLLRRRT